MFRYKTAWFSSSVPKPYLNFWTMQGGTITGWSTANYLFSEDATCPDTLRIFGSKDYLFDKVTVFHSLFLSTCQKRKSVKSVYIGHYVLPPASVQDEVRQVVGRLIWECEGEQSAAQDCKSLMCLTEDGHTEVRRSDCDTSDTDSSESEALLLNHRNNPVNYTFTGEDDGAVETGSTLLAMSDEILEENVPSLREEKPTNPSTSAQVHGYLSEPPIPREQEPLHYWASSCGRYPDMEVHGYLSEPPIPREQEPLHYWASSCGRYPDMEIAAHKFFSPPTTSVGIKRLFCAASYVVDDKRNRILCEKAEMLLFVKMNFAFVKKSLLIPQQS